MVKEAPTGDVTALLREYAQGDQTSLNSAVALIYQELQQLARAQLRRSSVREQHLDTTVLVHEAYEKLVRGQTQVVTDRRHFFAIASRTMRQIVVDFYRAQTTQKRGAEQVSFTVTSAQLADIATPERLLQIDRALEQLGEADAELAELVDLVCFGGMSNEAVAELLGVNVRSVQRKLQRARAWLGLYLSDAEQA